MRDRGSAPYLDYRPLRNDEPATVEDALDAPWPPGDMAHRVVDHAIAKIVTRRVEEVNGHRLPEIQKVVREVTVRLKKEINHWDRRDEDLKAQECAWGGERRHGERARRQ